MYFLNKLFENDASPRKLDGSALLYVIAFMKKNCTLNQHRFIGVTTPRRSEDPYLRNSAK